MWLNRHHTCGDIIDLDHLTGRWRPVDEGEKPAGASVLADLPVYGSYEIEDGKCYYKYWTDDNAFVFRTPENQVFEICRKTSDGKIIESQPGLHAEIADSQYSDGRVRQGFSDFRLLDKDDKLLYELSYNSAFYLRLYGSDFTAASMVEDLSDWDFFVALKGGIEIFAERAASGRIAMTYNIDGSARIGAETVKSDDVLSARTGETCEKTGVWAVTDDIRGTARVEKGAPLPSYNDSSVLWVWCREE